MNTDQHIEVSLSALPKTISREYDKLLLGAEPRVTVGPVVVRPDGSREISTFLYLDPDGSTPDASIGAIETWQDGFMKLLSLRVHPHERLV